MRRWFRGDPEDADFRVRQGVALRESWAPQRALRELEEAVCLNPDSAQAHFNSA